VDLKEVEILGDAVGKHWYYLSKARALRRLVPRHDVSSILDVGAGSGFFSKDLLGWTTAKEAWCVDTSYAEERDDQVGGKTIHFRRSIDSSAADLVLLMDVLEHVDDDRRLLAEYASKVKSGTRFVVSVPAFQFLWSGHDEFLGHRRRYTLAEIENSVRSCGLKVMRGCYYFALVFPLAAAIRLAGRLSTRGATPHSQLTRHSAVLNGALAGLCAIELPLLMHNRLAGLTAFCIAEKP
jgi:SAM-dependent methyltransferase